MPSSIITGPAGAGKTTVAAAVARRRPLGVHLPTDYWYHWIVNGYISPWKAEANLQDATVISAIAAAAGQYSAGGYDVIVDGIVGPWFLDHFLARAHEQANTIAYVVLRPAPGVVLQRATDRTNDHDLKNIDVINQISRAFEDLGLFESHVIDSTTQDPADTVEAVLVALSSGNYTLTSAHHEDQQRLARTYDVPPVPQRR